MSKELRDSPNLNQETHTSSNRGSFDDYSVHSELDTCSLSQLTGSRGVDKIVIHVGFLSETIQINDFLANLARYSGANAIKTKGGKVAAPGLPAIHVRWGQDLMPNGRIRNKIRMEFNPSHFRASTNLAPCPFGELIEVCKEAILIMIALGDPEAEPDFMFDEETGEHHTTWPSDWASSVTCSRLDLAQDFYVSDARFKIAQLRYRRPEYSRGVTNHINGKRINTVSHVSSSKSVQMKIYDKYEQSKKRMKKTAIKSSPGHIRYEATLRYAPVRENGLLSLGACTEENLTEALRKQWDKSNYGLPLFSEEHFMASIMNTGLSFGEASDIFYYLYCKENKLEFPEMPDRQIRDLRSTMRQLGIRVTDGLTQPNFSYGYLDFDAEQFIPISRIVQPLSIVN
jgi:hypothetical protein